jgi:AcrR family transcriptional regulator
VRANRSAYLESALELLAESGSEGLLVSELCARLGVTKGSFYHHFSGMPDLISALLVFWEQERSERLIAASSAELDPSARVRLLVSIAVGLPHAAEAALRAWGRSNAEVRTVVERVDSAREQHLFESMLLAGVPSKRARLHAKIAMAILVGTQQRENPVDVHTLGAMLEELNAQVMPYVSGPSQ